MEKINQIKQHADYLRLTLLRDEAVTFYTPGSDR